MKKILFIMLLTFTMVSIFSQGLNTAADYIKTNYSSKYQETIRKHALNEWGSDYTMVVYEINTQSDALVDLINMFESDNTQILFEAMKNWSYDGYETSTVNLFKQLTIVNLEEMIKFHCDWVMVKYQYNNQAKAKNSF